MVLANIMWSVTRALQMVQLDCDVSFVKDVLREMIELKLD